MRQPYYHGPSIEATLTDPTRDVMELTISSVDQLLSRAKKVQGDLSIIPVKERLAVIEAMGRTWYDRYQQGDYEGLKADLARSTSYSQNLIDLELSLVPAVLSAANMERNLMASLIGGPAALERFKEIDDTEWFLQRPAGPVFIISSGNSIVPTLIPTVLSLVTGNLTLLKPSLSNYDGVLAVLRTIENAPDCRAKEAMRNALVISYFAHDSPTMDHVLTKASVGVINFWGGEPARTMVAKKVAENPHRPHLVVNGPLTGVAWIEAGADDEEVVDGLALNIILYDQQLCSSPTSCIYIGEPVGAKEFASRVAAHLDEIGSDFPMVLDEGRLFSLNNFRRAIQMGGATVLSSRSMENPWTIIVSKERSSLDAAMVQYPRMNLYARRRFIEIVVLKDEAKALDMISSLPRNPAFAGIDKVQSVGMAVGDERAEHMSLALASVGVYRIVPVGDMYMRSAVEPYDGVALASPFTYTVYRRSRNTVPEGPP